MKQYLNKLMLLLLPLPLLLGSCKKDGTGLLPAATTTGANTMGASVNGQVWVANGGTGFQPAKPVEGGYLATSFDDETGNNVLIDAVRKDATGFQIYLRDVSKPGEYPLNATTNLFGGELRQPMSYGAYYTPGKVYMTSSGYTGRVTVTRADTVNRIVSGYFEFTAVHGGQTVTVSNGRFDVSTF